MQHHAQFKVTRTDDFVFKSSGKRREPIAETYPLNISIEDLDDELSVHVEYPGGLAGLLSSFQLFSRLGWLLKVQAVQPAFQFRLSFDIEQSHLQLEDKNEIDQQLEQLKYLVHHGASSDERDDIENAFDFLAGELETYLLKDVEIILLPLFLDEALFEESFDGGYYETPGFIQADAAHIEVEGDDLYIACVNGMRMVQKLLGTSMRKLLKDFRSYNLVVDESTDAHINYQYFEINRKSALIRHYFKLYRANSTLTDKRLSVEISDLARPEFE